MLTLVASALAGGGLHRRRRCAARWWDGRCSRLRGQGAIHPGTFLRSFRWGHVRQLDRVSRQLLARAWAVGRTRRLALTIDLDSTICETYGLAKEGARHHGYTGARGYHPLLAIAAGTGEVLMSRLREGRANTARGAAHFLRETVGGCATAGPGDNSRCGPTAASTPTLSLPPAGKWMSASLSPSASAPACGT